MSDTFDELRIIAKDGARLSSADRDLIRRAADELEQIGRMLVSTQATLIEEQQRRIAANEARMRATAEVQRLRDEANKPKKWPPYDPTKWGVIKCGPLK